MNPVLFGLREGALTITYILYLRARAIGRRLATPITVGVRVLTLKSDSVLLIRHRGGRFPWSLPGGGVNRGEAMADAAIRELREEAGCPTTGATLHGLFHRIDGGVSDYIATFVCPPTGEARAPVADLEIVDARFFSVRDLPTNLDPGSRRRIAEHQRGERGLYASW